METEQIWKRPEVVAQAALLQETYRRWTGRDLLSQVGSGAADLSHAEGFSFALYHAPMVVVAHGVESDPIFNYANLAAQRLWEMDWARFTRTPSRLSAEPMEQETRNALMASVRTNGFATGVRTVRVSVSGKRFEIENVTVWNLDNAGGRERGQAAVYAEWHYL